MLASGFVLFLLENTASVNNLKRIEKPLNKGEIDV